MDVIYGCPEGSEDGTNALCTSTPDAGSKGEHHIFVSELRKAHSLEKSSNVARVDNRVGTVIAYIQVQVIDSE